MPLIDQQRDSCNKDRSPRAAPSQALSDGDARHLVDRLPGFAFTLEHDGHTLRFTYASAGCLAVCGLTHEELNARTTGLESLIDARDRPAFQSSLMASAVAGVWNWEGRLQTPHGRKWVNIRAQTWSLGPLLTESVGIMLNVSQSHQRERELRDMSAEMRSMALQLESVREQERARLARDLHDDLGQVLTALKMDLASLHHVLRKPVSVTHEQLFDSMDRLIDAAADTGRRIALELRPSVLDLGLEPALRWLADQHRARYGIGMQCSVRLCMPVDPLMATEIFRIAQEALTNIARHAQASQAWLNLAEAPEGIHLEVRDDGKGFAAPQAVPGATTARPGFGLRGMRERALLLGGSFSQGQAPEGGAMIRVCLPPQEPSHA